MRAFEYWGRTTVTFVILWVLSGVILLNSCLNFGGSGGCNPIVDFPVWLVIPSVVWFFLGLPATVLVLLIALYKTSKCVSSKTEGSDHSS